MKNVMKCIAAVLALTLIVCAFVGCASQPNNEKPDEPASALERIKADGKLVMLTNAAFPPFEYLGGNNDVIGVDVQIAQAIADEIGVTLEVVDMDFDGIVMAIHTGKGDLGVAGMTATDERRKSVDFSVNYVSTTQVIIVRADETAITTPDDLIGKKIGVQMGTTGDLFGSDIEDAEIYRYKTGADASIELANGKLDAVILDEMPAKEIAAGNSALKVLEEPFTEEEYAIAIAKGNDDLKEVVDKVLGKLVADGTVDAWIEEHMASSEG